MSKKKNQLTYSVIVDEEYGYKRTHIRICERPIVDLVERLQRTLVNGPDGFLLIIFEEISLILNF